jgi:hypothetical protein
VIGGIRPNRSARYRPGACDEWEVSAKVGIGRVTWSLSVSSVWRALIGVERVMAGLNDRQSLRYRHTNKGL